MSAARDDVALPSPTSPSREQLSTPLRRSATRRLGIRQIVALALVFRAATSLHPYSGEGLPPRYGDYEAQRHWMELAVALPPRDWYRDSVDNDLTYWGIDYPPISAYASYVTGKFLEWIEPAAVALRTSHGFESPASRAAMRLSVLVSDVFIFLPAVVTFAVCSFVTDPEAVVAFSLSLPALVLIDHAHFQYNGVSLGLYIACVSAFATNSSRRHMLGAVLFCLSVYFKQMSLYYAPAVAAFLLGSMFRHRSRRAMIVYALKIATCVVGTTVVVFSPWLVPWEVAPVVRRIFPVARGLYEDKVANVWCSLSIVLKLNSLLSKSALLKLCATFTLATSAPFCVAVARRPTVRQLLLSSAGCALAAYLFSYQVHEKQILIPLIPLALLADSMPVAALWFSLVAAFSLYPLLDREGLVVAYVVLTCAHVVIAEAMLSLHFATQSRWPRQAAGGALAMGLVLHLLKAFGPAVPSKPDIYVMMMTMYACAHFCCLYIVLLYCSIVDE
jgi:alpha-1,3-glucosyltransferase